MSRSLRQPLDFRPLFKLRLVVAAHGAWSAALVQDLPSAVGQMLLDKAGQGTTVASFPMGEVKGLPIVSPHPSELHCAQHLEEEEA